MRRPSSCAWLVAGIGLAVLACDGTRSASVDRGAVVLGEDGDEQRSANAEYSEYYRESGGGGGGGGIFLGAQQVRFGRASEGLPRLDEVSNGLDNDASVSDFPGDEVNLDQRSALVERHAIPAGADVIKSDDEGPRTGAAGHGGHYGGLSSQAAAPAAKKSPAKTWKRSQIVPNTSRLRVGDNEELPLDGVEASVRIDGTRARVVLDCLFRNDRDRQLEGTFDLRLPNEATPFWFAFGECVRTDAPETKPAAPSAAGVQALFLGAAAASAESMSLRGLATTRERTWTKPKEARMVPRERAAWAYTESTRRRVDPALVEWTGADFFSARVFPLAPGATHRIVVAYDVDLVPAGDDFEFRLDLPQDIPQRSVTVTSSGGITLTPAAQSAKSGEETTWTLRNPMESAVVARLAKPDASLLTGNDDAAGACFAVTVRPDLPATDAASQPSRAVFLVDTSLSSGPERFPVWLKLVRQILDRNRASLREFAVLYFDVQTRWWRRGFTPNTPENVDALLADADKLSLEGATDLCAALAEASSPAWRPSGDRAARHDLFLLSDGAATWGAADRTALDAALSRGAAGAVWAYQTGLTGTDSATLAHLARSSGGAVFSVTGDAEVAAAATAHAQRPYLLRGVSVAGGSDVLVAGRPTAVHAGQTLRIAGRGAVADGAPVVLHLERDGKPVEVAVHARVVPSDLAVRAYGQIAVGQIEEWGDVADSPARAYATHFRVVGSTCSLLMLESEEDYARYGIKPADDAKRVRSELASDFVAKIAAERRRAASTPRTELLAWFGRLAAMPGMEFKLPDGFTDVVGRMPDAAFREDVPPLDCRMVRWSDVPGALQETLAGRTFDYDATSAEAARRLAKTGGADALRAVSSLVENRPGDTALARDVAFRALDWGLPGQAVHLLQRVARLRPYEPETYRVLADTYARAGNCDAAILWSEVALAGKFDGRFGDFRTIASGDYVRLLRRVARGEVRTSVPDFAKQRLADLERTWVAEQPSLVVVLSWNTDRTDVDLHVVEPSGEECFYSHQETKSGGRITSDVTQGFGPEMYRIAKPAAGEYRVRVHYYASDRSRASVRSQAFVTVYENWGRPDERVTRKVVTLATGGEQMQDVATVRVPK